MTKQHTIAFTAISGICCIILLTISIRYILITHKGHHNGKQIKVDPLVNKYAKISLFGYTVFVLIAFILDLIASLWYIPSLNITYTKLLCQLQTFNIAFFMIGKLAMYLFFMILVHVSFKGSFLAYPSKVLGFLAITFFIIMCVIGGFYMVFLFQDFNAVESLTSPNDCLQFNVSTRTSIVIYIGSTFDALWSFTCLLLFCLRLRTLTKILQRQKKMSRKNVVEMEKKYNPHYEGDSTSCSTDTLPKGRASPTPTTNITISNTAPVPSSSCAPIIWKQSDMEAQKQLESEAIEINTLSNNTDKSEAQKQVKLRKGSSGRSSLMASLHVKVNTLRLRVKKKKKKQPTMVQKFLPVMLKLTILSTWCAVSTATLGFSLWTLYPSLSSVIDSTINAVCLYLSFAFVNDVYEMLCLPFISCKRCMECVSVIKEVNQLEKTNVFDRREHSVLG